MIVAIACSFVVRRVGSGIRWLRGEVTRERVYFIEYAVECLPVVFSLKKMAFMDLEVLISRCRWDA